MKVETNHKPLQKSKGVTGCVRTLGPVPDLEEHVQPDWWRWIFNSIYLKTDGDVIDDTQITTKEADLFSDILKLSPEDKILDLCCGQGRISLELARRGFDNVEGLDRSRYLIQKAKAQNKKEGLGAKFREGDARKLPYQPDIFDVVMIPGNSFGYFETPQDDIRVLKEVLRVLKPWGKILIAFPAEVLGMGRQKLFCLQGTFPFFGQTTFNFERSGHTREKRRCCGPVLRRAALYSQEYGGAVQKSGL
jgi:D-alanine-D-alanine ligase